MAALGVQVTAAEAILEAEHWTDSPPLDAELSCLLALGRKFAVREAKAQGLAQIPDERDSAYASRFLDAVFSPKTSCPSPTEVELARAYTMRRGLYVHPDIFHIVDGQFVCCPRERAPCLMDPTVEGCLQRARDIAPTLFAAMSTAAPDRSLIERTLESLRLEIAGLDWNSYRVAYDFDLPHGSQPGRWLVLDKSLIDELRHATAGTVVGPVQSEYGIHVLFVAERKPKSMRTLDDPTVRDELREALCRETLSLVKQSYLRTLATQSNPTWTPSTLDEIRAALDKRAGSQSTTSD